MYLQLHIYFSDQPSLNQAMLLFSYQVVSNSCDSMNCSMPGFPVHLQLPALAETDVHGVSDAITSVKVLQTLLIRSFHGDSSTSLVD